MAFTLSGTTITQTGTDANLSGLSGLAGVTTTTTNPQSSADRYDIYIINSSTRLEVRGTLTIEPDSELVILEGEPSSSGSSAPLRVTTSGVLNFGVAKISGNKVIYSQGIGMMLTNEGSDFFSRDAAFVEGTMNWNGGIIRIAGTFTIGDAAYLTVNYGTIYNSSTAQDYQLRIEANSLNDSDRININLLRYDGKTRPARIFSTYSFGTLGVVLARGQYQPWASAAKPSITLTNLDNANNLSPSDVNFENSSSAGGGTDTVQNCSARLSYSQQDSGRNGYLVCFRQMNCPVVDLAGDDVAYSYYGIDTNNGSRGVSPNGDDDTVDKIYSGINQTGNFSENLLFETVRCESSIITVDDRVNGSDTIPITLISYLEIITNFTPVLIGLNSQADSIVMIVDSVITQTNKTTVDAYTTIDTGQQFYDKAKAYLVDNYTGETATIVSRSGNTIDAGAYNVTVVQTGAAFALSGTTITINTSSFVGNIITTGLVTGKEFVAGFVFDNTQDSSVSDIGGNTFKVYASASDRDSRANAIATDVASYSFVFASIPANPLYFWVQSGNTELPTELTVVQGSNTLDLGTGALLTALPLEVDKALANRIDGIDLPNIVAVATRTELGTELTLINTNLDKQLSTLKDFDPAASTVITDTASRNASKANVSALSTFNAVTDTVTAGNMRGTDNANTVTPDNTSISTILVDTNELQANQNNWNTATGFSTFDNATDSVITDVASRNASKADVSALISSQAAQTVQITAIEAATNDISDFKGLTLGSPATFTPTGIVTGAKSVTITGNGVTSTTVTRDA